MKRMAIAIILVVMLFAGCNEHTGNDNPETVEVAKKNDTESITPSHEKDENQVGNKVEIDNPPNSPYQDEIAYSIFEKGKSFQVGDLVIMGNYAHGVNYYIPIQWLVLEEKNGAVLLLSLYGISVEEFYDEFYFENTDLPEVITWENSTVRAWLNEVFFQSAFYKSEQECIKSSMIDTQDNSIYGTSGGESTQDYLFLLSEDEVKRYLDSDEERKTQTVPAMRPEYGVPENEVSSEDYNGWWLRSLGEYGDTISYVTTSGEVNMSGTTVWDSYIAVRPAMWVDLDSVRQYSEWLYGRKTVDDINRVDEGVYQQILHSLPEYKSSFESIGLSYKTVKELGLYDTYSSFVLVGEDAIKCVQMLGEQWCKADEGVGIREVRGNYSIFETSNTLNTIFMRDECIWELPSLKNQYIPRSFLLSTIDGTNQISEIEFTGYVKNMEEKEEMVGLINELLKLMNTGTEVSTKEPCGSYKLGSILLSISCVAGMYSEELGEYYNIRFY